MKMNELIIKSNIYMKTSEDDLNEAINDLKESYPGLEFDIEYAVLTDENDNMIENTIVGF